MGKKIRDDEKMWTLIVCGVFSLVMILCLIFAGHYDAMTNFWTGLLITFTVLTGISWYLVIHNMYDPAYDKWRFLNILCACVVICIVMGNRAGWMEDAMFKKDVEKNKMENAAP